MKFKFLEVILRIGTQEKDEPEKQPSATRTMTVQAKAILVLAILVTVLIGGPGLIQLVAKLL